MTLQKHYKKFDLILVNRLFISKLSFSSEIHFRVISYAYVKAFEEKSVHGFPLKFNRKLLTKILTNLLKLQLFSNIWTLTFQSRAKKSLIKIMINEYISSFDLNSSEIILYCTLLSCSISFNGCIISIRFTNIFAWHVIQLIYVCIYEFMVCVFAFAYTSRVPAQNSFECKSVNGKVTSRDAYYEYALWATWWSHVVCFVRSNLDDAKVLF